MNREGWSTAFVSGWHDQQARGRCSGGQGSVDYDDTHHRVHYSVPVTCPMRPGADQARRIRLSLVTRTEDERATDPVPAKHRFGRWVLWK